MLIAKPQLWRPSLIGCVFVIAWQHMLAVWHTSRRRSRSSFMALKFGPWPTLKACLESEAQNLPNLGYCSDLLVFIFLSFSFVVASVLTPDCFFMHWSIISNSFQFQRFQFQLHSVSKNPDQCKLHLLPWAIYGSLITFFGAPVTYLLSQWCKARFDYFNQFKAKEELHFFGQDKKWNGRKYNEMKWKDMKEMELKGNERK